MFQPTYKYNQGTNNYDTVKHKTPAWTDRVLFSQKVPVMTLTRYNRAEITVSDHKPIFAHFKVKVNKVDEDKKAEIEESLIAAFNEMKLEEQQQSQHKKQVKQRTKDNSGAGFSDADFAAA